MDSIFDFLNFIFYPWIHFFPYWWNEIANSSSILGIIFYIACMLFSLFVLCSATIILLIVVPTFSWSLVIFLLTEVQKKFNFKFPIIGDYLYREDEKTQRSVDRLFYLQDRSSKRKIACILQNRDMTPDEYYASANIYDFKNPNKIDIVNMTLLAKKIWQETNERDKRTLQNIYEKGELDSWLENLIYEAKHGPY